MIQKLFIVHELSELNEFGVRAMMREKCTMF